MGYYLMIKEAKEYDYRYLCKCIDSKDHIEYSGSGKLWRRFIDKHNPKIETTVLGWFETNEELRAAGEYFSEKFNVVKDKRWANLIPEVGDGGPTTKGFKACHDPVTGERRVLPIVPQGWQSGFGKDFKGNKGRIRCHHPKLRKNLMVETPEDIPDGYVLGGMKGCNYGPKIGSKVCHNGKGKKKYISEEEEIPAGWYPGSGAFTSRGRIACFDPKTKSKKYVISEDEIPDGWVKGQPPTTGKTVKTPDGVFTSISECCKHYGISRQKFFSNCQKMEEWEILND